MWSKPMKLSLIKVKHAEFASQETNCFEAVVVIDGVPSIHVSNQGHGGGDNHYDIVPGAFKRLAETEAKFNGQYFFTDKRIPLLESIAAMQAERAKNPDKYKVEADFGCQNAICGV